jgi:Zn-dependent protease with chaperone function
MSFIKHHLLPALLVLVIPCFSIWFFGYAVRATDNSILTAIVEDIKTSPAPSAAKQEALAFWNSHPVSEILSTPPGEMEDIKKDFAETATHYSWFALMQQLGWFCLGVVAVTLIVVGTSAGLSFGSHTAQYRSLRIGLPLLKVSALLQVLGQGVLTSMLSYWVTAILFERISIKLVGVIVVLAGLGVLALIKAIFTKVPDVHEIDGKPITAEDAPELWTRIRDLATKLGAPMPDRVIGGIEATFFVTEHPITLEGTRHEGRTLFVSLPMLKIMSIDEADSVLAHELAHFSGDDTVWSRKIGPRMTRFGMYLDALSSGLSVAVAAFMILFWKIYQLSISKLSREREFRADTVGGSATSPAAMARALVKVVSYSDYRNETLMKVLQQDKLQPEMRFSQMLEDGYRASLHAFTGNPEALVRETPHPFDSHPPLDQRLRNLGLEPATALADSALAVPPARTWFEAMPKAAEMEEAMWQIQHSALSDYPSADLAWRYLPSTPEEVAHVLLHFPDRRYHHKDGTVAHLTYDRIAIGNDSPALFKEIQDMKVEDTMTLKSQLTIALKDAVGTKRKVKFIPSQFSGEDQALIDQLQLYYGRYKTAEIRHLQEKA